MKKASKAAKARVLIVEDDTALGASTSALLEAVHYDVTRSRSRISSLTALLDNQFDIVLLDLNLGGGDFEGLRIIEAANVINTPFFIQKPFTAEGLTRVIELALAQA